MAGVLPELLRGAARAALDRGLRDAERPSWAARRGACLPGGTLRAAQTATRGFARRRAPAAHGGCPSAADDVVACGAAGTAALGGEPLGLAQTLHGPLRDEARIVAGLAHGPAHAAVGRHFAAARITEPRELRVDAELRQRDAGLALAFALTVGIEPRGTRPARDPVRSLMVPRAAGALRRSQTAGALRRSRTAGGGRRVTRATDARQAYGGEP